MSVQLNHTIIWCRDKHKASKFLASMLGLAEPRAFLHFMVVELDNAVSLDFMQTDGKVSPQHFAFLIGEQDFDAVLARIRAQKVPHWADPARTLANEVNRHAGGRGVYFEDPDGHLLEVLTKPITADDLPEV